MITALYSIVVVTLENTDYQGATLLIAPTERLPQVPSSLL
jgi:hypothetical protein